MQRFDPNEQVLKALLTAQSTFLGAATGTTDSTTVFLTNAARYLQHLSKADLVYVFKTRFAAGINSAGENLLTLDRSTCGISTDVNMPDSAVRTGRDLAEIFLTRGEERIGMSDIVRLRGQPLATDVSALLPKAKNPSSITVTAVPCTGGDQDRMAAIALFISDIGPDDATQIDMLAINVAARIIGETIQVDRKRAANQSKPQSTRQPRAISDWEQQAAVAIDAFWEADHNGRITTLIPLSDTFKGLDRSGWLNLSLPTLEASRGRDTPPPLAEPISQNQAFRDRTVKLPPALGRQKVSLSGAPILPEHRDGVACFAGSLKIITDDKNSEDERRALMTLVARLERARDRERHLREESETLLEGLRLLSQPLPSRQIFDGLFGLLQGTLGFQGAVLVHRNWQGRLVASMATQAQLEALDWKQVADQTGDGLPKQPSLLSFQHPLISAINDGATCSQWQSGLLVFIELENQPAWLICLHEEQNFFDMGALGLAGRLALLTSQALSHEAERNKTLQSAKLATLGEMATGIAHEINQPLAAISLAAQNLELALEDEPVDIEYANSKVDSIQSQTERASRIVNQMRVFARQSYDQSGTFKASDQITAALGIIGEQLRSHGIILSHSFMDNEPLVIGDALQFEQVVLNLFSNARDAIDNYRNELIEKSPTAQFEGQITLTQFAADDGFIKIRFADNGGGIPDEIMPQLFDPFFTTKPVGEGTGLGLSISYGIMRDMGGAIEASNSDEGAQIDLILKIAPPPQS